ncbi:MAG: hypothetical protein KIH69_009130 [Anaerolineae bacterium]|nr:hypothetical protein [Anaerolineae bacterium]
MNVYRRTHSTIFIWGASVFLAVSLLLSHWGSLALANEPEQREIVFLPLLIVPMTNNNASTATPTVAQPVPPDGPLGPGVFQPPSTGTPGVAPIRPTPAMTPPPDGFGGKPTPPWTPTPTASP